MSLRAEVHFRTDGEVIFISVELRFFRKVLDINESLIRIPFALNERDSCKDEPNQ